MWALQAAGAAGLVLIDGAPVDLDKPSPFRMAGNFGARDSEEPAAYPAAFAVMVGHKDGAALTRLLAATSGPLHVQLRPRPPSRAHDEL